MIKWLDISDFPNVLDLMSRVEWQVGGGGRRCHHRQSCHLDVSIELITSGRFARGLSGIEAASKPHQCFMAPSALAGQWRPD